MAPSLLLVALPLGPVLMQAVERRDCGVRAAFEKGRNAWPGLNLAHEVYALRLTSVEIADVDLAERAEDIYLALACVGGDPGAHRIFEAHYLSQVPRFVKRFRFAPHLVDEVQQRVRIKQLLGARPGLSRYRGRGPLGGWVRTTAVRVASDVASQREGVSGGGQHPRFDVWAAFEDGPEETTIKNFYRPRLTRALEDSLAALSPRDKTLLRLHVIEQHGIDPMGRTFGVHRATAARWLAAVRHRVFDELTARAASNWGTSTAELRELLAILREELDVGLARVLGEVAAAPDAGAHLDALAAGGPPLPLAHPAPATLCR